MPKNKQAHEEPDMLQQNPDKENIASGADQEEDIAGQQETTGTENLEQLLQQAEQKADEYQDAWMRAKAETENMRRRAQEDIAKASKFAGEKFASAMLPVKDSLEAALATENQTLEKLVEGVELTLKQLVSAFGSAGLAEENPLNQKFDPNRHQAISAIEAEADPNTVIEVLQKGYMLHDRVIRPALVIVSKAKEG